MTGAVGQSSKRSVCTIGALVDAARRTLSTLPMLVALLLALVALVSAPSEAQAAIALRGSTTATAANAATLTIAKPAGVVAKDMMIATISKSATMPPLVAPAGWTLIDGKDLGAGAGGAVRYGAVLYRVADGTEGPSFDFSFGPTPVAKSAGAIVAFSGVKASPFDVAPGTLYAPLSNTTTVAADSITTVSENTAVVMCGTLVINNPISFSDWMTATSPGVLGEICETQYNGAAVGVAWAPMPTAGLTGQGTATLSRLAYSGGILLALRPTASVTVSGTVKDASTGVGIPFSRVRFELGGSTVAETDADYRGRYSINLLPAIYTAYASAPGWGGVSESVDVPETDLTEDFALTDHYDQAVYRFFNMKGGVHFYTASDAEFINVYETLASVFHYDGIAYFVDLRNTEHQVPLYRFFNRKTGVHFYTASEAEKANVIATRSDTYTLEGIAYGVRIDGVGLPVYRFYVPARDAHFYTVDTGEIFNRSGLSNYYHYEGIGFWVGGSED